MTDYLWLDLETTGLNHKTCRIIEAACVLSKDDMVPYAAWRSIVYQNPNVGWEGAAQEMHQKSGLFEKVQTVGIDERVVQQKLFAFLDENLKDNKANLAGNSIHFDRSFLVEQWPGIQKYLTHRHLDVSSFKILAEGRGVKKFSENAPAHRAMDDVNNSFKELNYYLQELKKL